MNPEIPATATKFAKEGEGRNISLLNATATPVYYGFNCRPRQVRYYKVEESVEQILKGGYARKDVEQFLEQVKKNYEKSSDTLAGYKEDLESVNRKIEGTNDYLARTLLRKEGNRIETKMFNYKYDKTDRYEAAIAKLTKFLAE